MDDKTNTGKRDDTHIDVNEAYELQYWAEKLNVSGNRLRDAVKAAGTLAEDVRKYLENH